VLTTSVRLVRNALAVRRERRVSLLFSASTPRPAASKTPRPCWCSASRLPDEVRTSCSGFEEYWKRLFERQPAGRIYGANPLTRYLFG